MRFVQHSVQGDKRTSSLRELLLSLRQLLLSLLLLLLSLRQLLLSLLLLLLSLRQLLLSLLQLLLSLPQQCHQVVWGGQALLEHPGATGNALVWLPHRCRAP